MTNRLVVLSGGQDSTTALFMAKQRCDNDGGRLHAITFGYGQQHSREIEAAKAVAEMAMCISWEVLRLPEDTLISSSPLTDPTKPVQHFDDAEAANVQGLDSAFVPFRNLLFIVIAANRAMRLGCEEIWLGVCQEDDSGFPDCRVEFLRAAEVVLRESNGPELPPLDIVAPVLNLSKSEQVRIAAGELPGCWEALAFTHTCYDGEYPPNPHNHASLLRARGFKHAGLPDPLILRAKGEGLLPSNYPDDGYVE